MDIDLKVWKYSSYGPHIKLLAPGVHIRSAGVETPYRLANGTSDSAAYVSAAAALLRSKFPDLTAGQIANRLAKTAILPDSMKGKKLPDRHYGYGIVNPWQALIKKMPKGSENGPLPALKDGSSNASSKDAQQAAESEKGMSTGVIIGIVGGVVGLLVVVLIVVLVVKKKNGRNGPPPGGPGGYGGPGGRVALCRIRRTRAISSSRARPGRIRRRRPRSRRGGNSEPFHQWCGPQLSSCGPQPVEERCHGLWAMA